MCFYVFGAQPLVFNIVPSAGRICSMNNGGCSHICADEPWGTLCICPDGYKLAPNGMVCEGVWESCSDTVYFQYWFLWQSSATSLKPRYNNIDKPYPHGWYWRLSWTADFSCPTSFFFSFFFLRTLVFFAALYLSISKSWSKFVNLFADVDECSSLFGPCAHHCINTIGSYYCRCTEGFKLEEGSTCLASGEALPNYPNSQCIWLTSPHMMHIFYQVVEYPLKLISSLLKDWAIRNRIFSDTEHTSTKLTSELL